jgi:hypothetical protein
MFRGLKGETNGPCVCSERHFREDVKDTANLAAVSLDPAYQTGFELLLGRFRARQAPRLPHSSAAENLPPRVKDAAAAERSPRRPGTLLASSKPVRVAGACSYTCSKKCRCKHMALPQGLLQTTGSAFSSVCKYSIMCLLLWQKENYF